MSDDDTLIALALVFAPLSLISVGGGAGILGDIQHQVTVAHAWMTTREFQDAFAISRVAPGPGILIVTLIGWHVAGLAGAIAATVAVILPSSVLIYGLAHYWHAGPRKRWQKALSRGLAPVAAGLILASVVRLLSHADGQVVAWIVAAGVGVAAYATKIGQISLLAIGTALFVGLVLLRASAGF
jgi:chromate transporter